MLRNRDILAIIRLEYVRNLAQFKITLLLMLILKPIIDFAYFYAHKLLIELSEIHQPQGVFLFVQLSLTFMVRQSHLLVLLHVQ